MNCDLAVAEAVTERTRGRHLVAGVSRRAVAAIINLLNMLILYHFLELYKYVV